MNNISMSVSLLAFLFGTVAIAQQPAERDSEEPSVAEKAETIVGETQEKVDEIAHRVDESEKAKEISAGILQPIYTFAEYLSFPAIHWLAFAIMITGVVSFALQLVLAKLVVMFRFGLSLTEIFSDALGLGISLVGLVLTTQAAAENSNFTQSPAAVLSATLVGAVAGFIFYWWGQSQEIQALEGRKLQAMKSSTTNSD
jgi:hypothetical protein